MKGTTQPYAYMYLIACIPHSHMIELCDEDQITIILTWLRSNPNHWLITFEQSTSGCVWRSWHRIWLPNPLIHNGWLLSVMSVLRVNDRMKYDNKETLKRLVCSYNERYMRASDSGTVVTSEISTNCLKRSNSLNLQIVTNDCQSLLFAMANEQ